MRLFPEKNTIKSFKGVQKLYRYIENNSLSSDFVFFNIADLFNAQSATLHTNESKKCKKKKTSKDLIFFTHFLYRTKKKKKKVKRSEVPSVLPQVLSSDREMSSALSRRRPLPRLGQANGAFEGEGPN